MSVNIDLYEVLKELGTDPTLARRAASADADTELLARIGRIESDVRSLLRFGVAAFLITWGGLIGLGLIMIAK